MRTRDTSPVRPATPTDARYAWAMSARHRQSLFISARNRGVTVESLDLELWRLRA